MFSIDAVFQSARPRPVKRAHPKNVYDTSFTLEVFQLDKPGKMGENRVAVGYRATVCTQ